MAAVPWLFLAARQVLSTSGRRHVQVAAAVLWLFLAARQLISGSLSIVFKVRPIVFNTHIISLSVIEVKQSYYPCQQVFWITLFKYNYDKLNYYCSFIDGTVKSK